MTIACPHEPRHEVTREWLIDMLASLEAGDIDDCKEVLKAALKLVEGGDWPELIEQDKFAG